VLHGPIASGAVTPGPEGPAFYIAPSPLPEANHGDVVWSRPLTGAAALPSAAKNIIVLYRTTSVTGDPVAVSGAIAIPPGPPPATGWPVVSWAHGTTGNGTHCAPSVAKEPGPEQKMLDHWVARGYVVLQTDYEGEGTPGIHPYFVGKAAGRDVTDIVRAARSVDPDIGSRWVAMGHSEGGNAALFTAVVAPTWAPELDLLGTVAIAPGSHITLALKQAMSNANPDSFFPLTLMMVQGMSSTDSAIDLSKVLSSKALSQLPEFSTVCADDLVEQLVWKTTPQADFFVHPADDSELMRAFLSNEASFLSIRVPVLLLQGDSDTIVSPQITKALADELCKNSAKLQLDSFAGSGHDAVLNASIDEAEHWVDDRFRNVPARSTCA
jgi:pimeloyl-ACP methyl ester carboxylesterase